MTWPCSPSADHGVGGAPASGATSRTREKIPARPADPGFAATSGSIVKV